MSEKKESFLQRKNVTISFQRYGIQAMGAMALGLFASLLIGTIIKTVAGTDLHPAGAFLRDAEAERR